MILKLGMEDNVLKLYKVYINDDPELTMTYFKTMSNLAKLIFMPPTLKKWGTYWFRLVRVCVCVRVRGIEISS